MTETSLHRWDMHWTIFLPTPSWWIPSPPHPGWWSRGNSACEQKLLSRLSSFPCLCSGSSLVLYKTVASKNSTDYTGPASQHSGTLLPGDGYFRVRHTSDIYLGLWDLHLMLVHTVAYCNDWFHLSPDMAPKWQTWAQHVSWPPSHQVCLRQWNLVRGYHSWYWS